MKMNRVEVVKKVWSPKKSIAIILAVLFGFWGWLYTYKHSKKKFWIAVAIIISSIFVLTAIKAASGFSLLISGLLWLWAVIDVCVKKREFYTEYPNG
jgi:hypothetical protein